MAAAQHLGCCAERRAGSTPVPGIKMAIKPVIIWWTRCDQEGNEYVYYPPFLAAQFDSETGERVGVIDQRDGSGEPLRIRVPEENISYAGDVYCGPPKGQKRYEVLPEPPRIETSPEGFLSPAEWAVVQRVIRSAASRDGEDVIGLLMKEGAFRELPGDGLVNLADKIDGHQ